MARLVRLAAVLLVVGALPAAAQPVAPPDRPPPSSGTPNGPPKGAAAACGIGQAGALREVGCELAHALASAPPGALVVSAPLTSDVKLAQPERLTSRIAAIVSGALGRGSRARDEPAKLARARTLASSGGTLIHLEIEIGRGELRVTADVYPAPRRFWARVRDAAPSPSLHAFVSRRIDAEIRTFLPPVPLVAGAIQRAMAPDTDAVALACDDTDLDGAIELVWVGRRRIHVGRLREGRFQVVHSASWPDLSPVAQSPLREPVGAVSIDPGRYLDVGISDRAYLVRLSPELSPISKPGRRVPWPGGGCTRFNALSLRAEIEPCVPGDALVKLAKFQSATDAVAGASVTTRAGEPRLVRAGRISNEPIVVLMDDRGKSAKLGGMGAQLAVGDLDGDGQPELLSGSNTLKPEADALIVHTWQDDGRLVERLRLSVPAGIRALAVCPPESAGLSPIAIATSDAVWVVR